MITWIEKAACAYFPVGTSQKEMGQRFALFHPPTPGGEYLARDVEKAKTLFCDGCPVRTECLEWALADKDAKHHGIYGGMSPKERDQIKDGRSGKRQATRLPKTLRVEDCTEPGRAAGVQRHTEHGQRLCLDCARYEAKQITAAETERQVRARVERGDGPSAIARDLGLTGGQVDWWLLKVRKRQGVAA